MKKSIVIMQLLFACSVLYASGDFLPSLPDGGETVSRTRAGMVTLQYQGQSVQQIAGFYKNLFQGTTDIGFRAVKENSEIIINDWGTSKWQKILITDNGDGSTMVLITKDSWTWILGTLIIRFVGVFVVLTVLLIVLNVLSSIVSKSLSNLDNKGKTEIAKQGS